MNLKRGLSYGTSGAFQGGATGATIGTAIAPGIGTAIGGGIGAAGGALAALLGGAADEEDQENDPEYKAAKRKERAQQLMSAALGRAFSGMKSKTMQGAMRAV